MSRSRILGVLLVLSMAAPATAYATPAREGPSEVKLAPSLRRAISHAAPEAFLPVVVSLRERAVLTHLPRQRERRSQEVIRRLEETADRSQAGLRTQLGSWRRAGSVRRFTPFWIFNGIAVDATPAAVAAIAARPEVLRVTLDEAEVTLADATPEPNVTLVNAPVLWNEGFHGEGIVVASLDTGVDVTHPDLAGSWRGGSNSWFDPYGQHPTTPTDLHGHGTSTMGVIVGGSAGGTAIGVAPGATWIAAKIFNDAGGATTSGIHAAFQWILDPDGNPATADAPDVVNNSWDSSVPGCDYTFQPDLQAIRATGILPIFAAGNGGPSAGTSFSPSNLPEAVAVGAVDDSDLIASSSSRGPASCGGSTDVFPDVVAPGVGIHTAERWGLYTDATGTSMAAPHVTGAIALLLQAFPDTSAADQQAAIEDAAVDLGALGPDDTYGNGRVDASAAHEWLVAHQPPPPPPALSIDLSLSAGGTLSVGSVIVRNEDVVHFDGTSFTVLIDASDVGITGQVDAFAALDADSFLLSVAAPATIAGLGTVDDSDLIRLDTTSLGPTTSGSLSVYFDGSDVGLDSNAEDVDAVEILTDGRMLLSTVGAASVAGGIAGADEDLLAFAPTTLGATTAGTFAVWFDGSDVGLTATAEDIDAASVSQDGRIYLSTLGAFAVAGASGDGDDVSRCTASSLGSVTSCSFDVALFVDGSALALTGYGIDAVEIS
jgi:subtilisin family serine protease